jgi:hypothetical protein
VGPDGGVAAGAGATKATAAAEGGPPPGLAPLRSLDGW